MKGQQDYMKERQKRNNVIIYKKKEEPSCGAVFFNYGNSAILRLFVALISMRKVYKGDITLMFPTDDIWYKDLIKDISQMGLNINFEWFELLDVRRKIKSSIKPKLFSLSPYDKTIMFDGDILVKKPFDKLFDELDKNGFLITQFSTWTTHKRTMVKRIKRMSEFLSEEDLSKSLDRQPAINIGVMGYKKGLGDELLNDWEKLTHKMRGKFLGDEIAIQGTFFKHPCSVVPSIYNYSCKLESTPLEDAVIIHYHGHKHARGDRKTSRMWWEEAKTLDKDIFEKWIQYDKYALRNREQFEK